MEIILIGDLRVKNIAVHECGDSFLDLSTEFPDLIFDKKRLNVQKKSRSISWGRRSLGQKLCEAQALLPPGLKLLIKECYRPLWIQKEFFEDYSNHLRKNHPMWDEQKIYDECSKLNAPIDVAPHSTGGAVDLTIIDSQGNWLDMGTAFNAEPLATDEATYTDANNISELAKKNRKILISAMENVGFANYPTEWWHWSYGDKYWALCKNHSKALFSSIENFPTIRIENEKWEKETFAKCNSIADVLREPHECFEHLKENEKDKIRQTQVEKNEIIRILGFHGNHALIMKWDNVIGWLKSQSFKVDENIKKIPTPISKMITPLAFFESWSGTPYLWGGVTNSGIDCSGFTQRYYLDVLDKVIPKNSKEQKKAGVSSSLLSISNHDLVFCYRIGGSGIHHVGVFFEGQIFHAQLERGVIQQSLEYFTKLYKVEEVVSMQSIMHFPIQL